MLRTLERRQVGIYLVALGLGGGVGLAFAGSAGVWERLIEPALGVLLFGMFAQIPFLELRGAFANRRFMAALLCLNFAVIPVVVWGLTRVLPAELSLQLGVCMVLLTPCIDYVIVFAHLGRGDARLILAATPLLLILQMIFLPVYLGIFLGGEVLGVMDAGPFLHAFCWLIAVPLALAVGLQGLARRGPRGEAVLRATAWLPVPFMAAVLFVVIASQITRIASQGGQLLWAAGLYVVFMAVVPLLARGLAGIFRLRAVEARSLAFSGGTRNSLVVLPLALALPEPLRVAVAAVIVTQTLVELVGELLYVRFMPRIIPDTGG